MALVAYDYSSGSDDEITDEEDESKVIITKAQAASEVPEVPQSSNKESTELKTQGGLFSHLPQVKTSVEKISEETDQLEDFIPTVKTLKEKKKVQITIPSLSEFDDLSSDEPVKKRPKPSQTGSGLLSLLPPVQSVPKSNTTFVPNSLKNKPVQSKPATTSQAMIPHSVKKALNSKKAPSVAKIKTDCSDSDTDTEDIPIPDTFDDQMWEKVCGRPKPKPKPVVKFDMTTQPEPEVYSSAPEPKKPYEGLGNEAFKELVGKSKRPIGNIKLIDINEDEILSDKDLWMTKSLTDPDLAPPKSDSQDDSIDPTKKRKHHITYLAHQAKANEQELKSAWATSKNNRMMSRAKYGF